MKQAPCSTCGGNTSHEVLFETVERDMDWETVETYELLKCGGCSTISMGYHCIWISDGSVDHKYYHPPSKSSPDWTLRLPVNLTSFSRLLKEIHQAKDEGLNCLAVMGLRALLEQVMISKVGDLGDFKKNLDQFHADGYISVIQFDTLKKLLKVGHGTMHRAFEPTEHDAKVVLDIVESVCSAIFWQKEAAKEIADRVPPRPEKPPKKMKDV